MREDYQNNIKFLRDEISSSRESVNIITKDIEDMLQRLDSDDGSTLITWNELQKTVFGETYNVNDKVRFVKVFEDSVRMEFKCYVEAGGSFGLQEHDIVEKLIVSSGHLIEQTRGDRIYEVGQNVIYAVNERHKPKSLVDSTYQVIFNKNKI